MGRTGHRLTGIAAGCLASCALWSTDGVMSLVAIPAGYFGGTSPDWLEISHAEYSSKYQRWMRKSVIPHRTITHWWVIWAAFSVFLAMWPITQDTWLLQMTRMAGIGFVAGAWMHLLMDIPNMSGIPILTPRAKDRFGFGWWRSGNVLEPLAGVLMLIGAGALLITVAHLHHNIQEFFPFSFPTTFSSIS